MAQQLTLNVLGSPDQGIIEEFRFFSGEERTLKLQVIEYVNKQKWSLPVGTTIALILSGTPADITVATADITIDSEDRSIFETVLIETQTALLITGLVQAKFEYLDGLNTITRYAVKEHALKKIVEA